MASKPIRWAIQPGLENFAGLAMYLRDQEENLKQAFSQPSRSVRKILPGHIVIDYVMNDVVDFIRISMLKKPPKGKGIPMVWNKQPPYKLGDDGKLQKDVNGDPTWALDFESVEMFEDPDVEGGYYFIVTVINGKNEKQEILWATFVINEGKDINGNKYPDWSIEQGERVISGGVTSYTVDGKTATILLGDEVEGDAVIIALDGETVLARKVAIPDEWRILYIPDPAAPTGKYIIARKTDLEPLKKYYKTTEAGYWPAMPIDADIFSTTLSDSSNTDRDATPTSEAEGPAPNWHRHFHVRDTITGAQTSVFAVKSSNQQGATIYWESPQCSYSMVKYQDWDGYKQWTDPDPEPDENSIIQNLSPPPVITYGPYSSVIYNKIGEYALEDSWAEDGDNNGFFIGRVVHQGTLDNYIITRTDYFVYNGVMHEVATSTYSYVSGVITYISGTCVQPVKVTCYKKEDLVDEDGEQPFDVAIASYSIGSERYSEGNLSNRTAMGYIAIINEEAIIKTFPVTGGSRYELGTHEITEKDGTQLYGEGWFEVHKRKGVTS